MDQAFEIKLFWVFWSFVLFAAGTVSITLLSVWAKRKVFGAPPVNSNGTGVNNGKLEKALIALPDKIEKMSKAIETNGKVQVETAEATKLMAQILSKEHPDGGYMVHNRPSIEKKIDDTHSWAGALWDKFKNLRLPGNDNARGTKRND